MLYLFLTFLFVIDANAQYTYTDFYYVDVDNVEKLPLTAVFSDQKDMGQCTCDLREGICDYHCCCDRDCDDTMKQSWKDASKCIDKHNVQREDNKCMNAKNTYNYNIKEAGLKYRDQIESLLCVKYDNGKDMGEFYETINPDSAQWSTILRNRFDLWVSANFPNNNQISTGGIGEPLVSDNSMNLFEADAYGRCVLTKKIKHSTDMTSSCGITSTTDCASLESALNSLLGIVSGNAQQSVDALIDGQCYTSIAITFTTENNSITNVEIDTVTADKPREGKVLRHTTTIKWRTVAEGTTSSDNPNALPKSGSPGYIVGKNLLLGVVDSTTNKFTIDTEGYVPYSSNNEGGCNEGLKKGGAIKFGVDYSVKCKFDTSSDTSSFSSLKIFQENINALKYVGIIGASNVTKSLDWAEISIEKDITEEDFVPKFEQYEDSSELFIVTTGMYLVVLTSTFGPKSNPQSYVLDARILFKNDLITITEGASQEVTIEFGVRYISVKAEQFEKDDKILSYQKYNETFSSD